MSGLPNRRRYGRKEIKKVELIYIRFSFRHKSRPRRPWNVL